MPAVAERLGIPVREAGTDLHIQRIIIQVAVKALEDWIGLGGQFRDPAEDVSVGLRSMSMGRGLSLS